MKRDTFFLIMVLQISMFVMPGIALSGYLDVVVEEEWFIQASFQDTSEKPAVRETGAEKKLSTKEANILGEIRERSFSSKDEGIQYLLSLLDKISKRGDFEPAILVARVITSLDIRISSAHDIKLLALKALKKFDEGISEYEQLSRTYPNEVELKNILGVLESARAENVYLEVGIKRAIKDSIDVYSRDKVRGLNLFQKVIDIYHKSLKYDDEKEAILAFKKVLHDDKQWEEAIKYSNKYLQIQKGEDSNEAWQKIQKTYITVFEDIYQYFINLNDYEGYVRWVNEYKKIENKRFATLFSDKMNFFEGVAAMRARDYEGAQKIFLNLYLNQPSSEYSKDAKRYYDGCKRAMNGVIDLSVQSEPPQADVYIDGLLRGKTPFKDQVPDQDFDLKVTMETYNPYETRIVANAAEGIYDVNVTLQTSLLEFKAANGRYCPGTILYIGDIGSVKWHDDCFELYRFDIEGSIQKVDNNTIRLKPGTYTIEAMSFGEVYIESGRKISDEITLEPGKTMVATVDGAYIGDEKYPFSITFSTK